MKYEDFIKKLENLETPEVELTGHKQALRFALLNSRRFQQRTIMDWARVVAPVTAALLLIAVVGFFNVIQPQMQMARARDIALNDWQVQEWIAGYGLNITEVKLQDGEALVFFALAGAALDVEGNLTRPAVPPPPESVSEELRLLSQYDISLSGYVIRVDLVEKRVTAFAKVNNVTGLLDINPGEIEFHSFAPPGNEPSGEGDLVWPERNLPC